MKYNCNSDEDVEIKNRKKDKKHIKRRNIPKSTTI